MLLRHRLSVTSVLAAVTAVAAVFGFARPQYHDPYPGRQFDLSYVESPTAGWKWPRGTPGFRFGRDEEVWNEAKLRPDDLRAAHLVAERSGVAPDSLRILNALRARSGDVYALLAGSGAGSRTCLAALVPGATTRFSCRLGRQAAFVVVAPRPRELYVLGVARSDVSRVTVDLPGLAHALLDTHRRRDYWWDAFGVPLELPRPWHGRLTVYGKHRVLASIPLSWRSSTWLPEP